MYCYYIRNLSSASLTVWEGIKLHLFPDFLLGALPVRFKLLWNQRFLRLPVTRPCGGLSEQVDLSGESRNGGIFDSESEDSKQVLGETIMFAHRVCSREWLLAG